MANRIFRVRATRLMLREQPNTGARIIARLDRGQLLARLDEVDWNDWWWVFVDVPGEGAFCGYVYSELLDEYVEPAPLQPAPEAPPAPPPAAPSPRAPAAGMAWPEVRGATTRWKGIIGHAFQPDEFEAYCESLTWTNWKPQLIVLHNTWKPKLSDRPVGFTKAQMDNLVGWYRDAQVDRATGRQVKGAWTAGPHLFVDDKQIWVFTPLTVAGRHSPSFNSTALGLEMLGDFETEDFNSGRGALVRDNAVAAMAILNGVLNLDPDAMKLHKEDTQTTHRTCPGQTVSKQAVIEAVKAEMTRRFGADHIPHTHDDEPLTT